MAEEGRRSIFVPFTAGLGTDADPRMRAPERLEIARNVRATETGTLAKRHGFSQLGNIIAGGGGAAIDEGGDVRALTATSRELLAIGHRNLFAYNFQLGGWVDRGGISPFVGTTQETFRSNVQYQQADGECTGPYCVMAAIRYEGLGDAVSQSAIEFRGKDGLGQSTFPTTVVQRLTMAGASSYPIALKCCKNGDLTGADIITLWSHATAAQHAAPVGGPGTLERYIYDATTPHAAPAPLAPFAGEPITTDLYLRAGARTFDGCAIPDASGNGSYVAFIDRTAQNINLRQYARDHTLSANAAIAPPSQGGLFYAVAICHASDDDFYVLAAEDNGQNPDIVWLWHMNNGLTVNWGPINVETLGGAPKETADNLGVAEGSNGTTTYAMCVYGVQEPAAATSEVHSRPAYAATGVLGTLVSQYNCIPYSDPFWHSLRCYVHIGTWTEEPYDGLGFETHLLIDLDAETTRTIDTLKMAAMWGVGSAPGLTTGYALGSNNSVWQAQDSAFHMMCPFIAEALKAAEVGGLGAADIRHAYDDVGFEYLTVPCATPLHRGCAVIGGAFVSWYDGTVAFELGFAKPPMVQAIAQNPAGPIPPGTYNYTNLWKHVDSAGILHRSLPSPGDEIEVEEEAPSTHTLTAMSLPGSRRPHRDITCEWYRAGADAIYRRVNRSAENIPNTFAAATLQTLTDVYLDVDLYVQRYTTGGVLEAVAPEGARIPHVTRERLWLGDFFRGDRVQYSKMVVPSAVGETAIAPELFEALGRISDRGERITGLSSLDAATVVFTERHVYLVAGYGPDNRGRGDDTSRLTEIPTDAGCIEPRSVVVGPDGVFFQTARGIYAIGRDHSVTPIGEPVRNLLDTYPVVTSAVLVPNERQVRFTVTNAAETDGRVLVYDYRIGAWFEWQLKRGASTTIVPRGAALVDSVYYVLDDQMEVYFEDSSTHYDNATVWVERRIKTGAIQPAGPLQWMNVSKITVMAEYKDDHELHMALYQNHGATAADSTSWPDATLQTLADANRMHVSRKPGGAVSSKVEAIAVELWDEEDGTPSDGEGFELHGIAVDIEMIGGAARLQSEAKQ